MGMTGNGGIVGGIARRARIWRDRYRYEVRRPRLSAADVTSRLVLDPEGYVSAGGVFSALLARHFEVTPQAPAWDGGEDEANMPEDTDWHLEPQSGVRWPQRFAGAIPDRLPGSDVVLLWHKNKMMPLLDIARRFEHTGERRWAEAWYRQVDSWCRQNPFMVGKNWRSPMEVGTRLVVWSQSLSMLRAAGPPDEETAARLIESVLRQADFVAAHFSEKDIPNNHLIGEAATLYVFAAYWPLLRDAPEWKARAERTLEREVERQILPDGFDYENSVNYHLYVLDFLLLYLHARALVAETPPAGILEGAARMLDAAMALVSPAGRFPQIGDDSMTEFLALQSLYPFAKTAPYTSSVTATDIIRPGMAAALSSREWGAALVRRSEPVETCRNFADAGIFVVRRSDSHLTVAAGPQHERPLSAGHLNLDPGSVEIEVDGDALFIDSGTYLYTHDPDVRRHFRGAVAHNTVTVDGREPVENTRVFGWDIVHAARVLTAEGFEEGGRISCERVLPAAGGARMVHRRGVAVVSGLWVIVDEVAGDGAGTDTRHEAEALWHTPCVPTAVTREDDHRFVFAMDAGLLALDVYSSGGHETELITDTGDMRTWYSRRYGEVQHGTTLRTTVPVGDGCRMVHVVRRADTPVRFDGWRRGGAALTVGSGPRTRLLEMSVEDLRVDGAIIP